MIHSIMKRTLAGVTAVICVAGNATATSPMFGGLYGGNVVVASAAENDGCGQAEGFTYSPEIPPTCTNPRMVEYWMENETNVVNVLL